MGHAFKGIGMGDMVTFMIYKGRGKGGGREYEKRTAKVNMLLIFEDHVVVNHGTYGEIVDESNYVSHKRGKA